MTDGVYVERFSCAWWAVWCLWFPIAALGLDHERNVVIEFEENNNDIGVLPENLKKWMCQRIGEFLQVKGGIYDHGIFKTYSCLLKPEEKGRTIKPGSWKLVVKQFPLQLLFTFKFGDADVGPKYFWKVKKWREIKKKGNIKQVAYELLESLPALRVVYHNSKENSGFLISPKHPFLAPPEKYFLFTLEWDEEHNIWFADAIGEATLMGSSGDQSSENQQVKWRLSFNEPPRSTVWAHPMGSAPIDPKRRLLEKTDTDGLGPISSGLGHLIEGVVSRGFVGMRYATSVTEGNRPLSNIPFLGIFGEFRDGPIEGLRVLWDFATENKGVVEGETVWFGWQRIQIGKNFDFPLDVISFGLLANLGILPKIGILDLDSRLLIEDSNQSLPVDFKFENALSLGVDFQSELEAAFLIFRLWGGIDASFLFEPDKNSSTSSKRIGLDTYLKQNFLWGSIDMAFLVFGFYEQLTLSTEFKGDIGATSANSISYNMGYIGVGVSVGW